VCAAETVVRYSGDRTRKHSIPFTRNVWNIIKGIDLDMKEGGIQIEQADQDRASTKCSIASWPSGAWAEGRFAAEHLEASGVWSSLEI
jgi:hypothetical protein